MRWSCWDSCCLPWPAQLMWTDAALSKGCGRSNPLAPKFFTELLCLVVYAHVHFAALVCGAGVFDSRQL